MVLLSKGISVKILVFNSNKINKETDQQQFQKIVWKALNLEILVLEKVVIVKLTVVQVAILVVRQAVKRIRRINLLIVINLGVKKEKKIMKRNILFSLFALKSNARKQVNYAAQNVSALDRMRVMKQYVWRL